MWRCKACGMIITPVDVEDFGSFCKECRNEQCGCFVIDVCIVCGWVLARRRILQRHVKEEVMRKRHVASEVHHMTMCGHETTYQEYEKMKKRDLKHVNCKKCLELLK